MAAAALQPGLGWPGRQSPAARRHARKRWEDSIDFSCTNGSRVIYHSHLRLIAGHVQPPLRGVKVVMGHPRTLAVKPILDSDQSVVLLTQQIGML